MAFGDEGGRGEAARSRVKRQEPACCVKAERGAAERRAATWLPGRTWTAPWAEPVGVAGAEPAGPQSACWGRAGALDV